MAQLHFEFVGTTCKECSLDPAEWAGQSVSQITEELLKILGEIAPGVNFFVDDIVLAAHELAQGDLETPVQV